MIRILLFCIFFNIVFSELNLVFSVQEKIMGNAQEGDLLPLIVKPTEDVNEDITIKCNGNIRYRKSDGHNPDLGDESPIPKIPAGTKAGTEIKFNCIIRNKIENENITIDIDLSLKNWLEDENNKKIEFVPKYCVSPSSSTYKNLEKNDIIELDMTLMSSTLNEITIEDGTFILKKENDNNSINLFSCSKIPNNQQKGKLKITCKVEDEVKEGNFLLELAPGKKIDSIEPKVNGIIYFSDKNKNPENEVQSDTSSNKDYNSSNSASPQRSLSENLGLLFILYSIFLLF